MHHNWYSTLCIERMPRVRYGQVHVFNNYYGCTGNNYCVGVGVSSQILLESSYFDNVTAPWKDYYSGLGAQGFIHWNADNQFVNTAIPTWAPNSTVFTPPYAYTTDAGANVKSIVTDPVNGAGAHLIKPGDLVIIATYAEFDDQEARGHEPIVVFVDAKNRVKEYRDVV